ncbi:MAG: spore cortex biosynthesis protein YabQ [Clostridia bacterium]
MFVTEQLIDFSQFIFIGIIIAVMFDFFRAYRKYKKVSTFTVIVQDIIYFILATLVVVIAIIFILNSNIRLHIFIALFIGFLLYISLLSKYIMKIYMLLFATFSTIFDIIITPIKLLIQFFQKLCNIFGKISTKCCKKFIYVLSFLHNVVIKIKSIFLKCRKIKTKEV